MTQTGQKFANGISNTFIIIQMIFIIIIKLVYKLPDLWH